MGFMDKVKSQATAIAEKAQEGAKLGQDKLSQMQAKKQSDALLLELGGLTYLERTGRGEPGGEARVGQLVEQLTTFEHTHGPVTVTPATPPVGESGTYVPSASDASPASTAPTGTSIPTSAPPPPPSASEGAPGGGGIPSASYMTDDEPAG